MENKYIGVLIGVAVAVIMVGSLLAPVINDTTATSDVYTNDGLFHIEKLDDGATAHYVWDGTTLTLNDVPLELPMRLSGYDSTSIIMVDNAVFRFNPNANTIFCRGAISGELKTFDIVVANGEINGTRTAPDSAETLQINITYTNFWGIVPDSDLVMCEFPAYVLDDSDVFVIGHSSIGAEWAIVNVSGTINDGFSVAYYNIFNGSALTDITTSNIVIDRTVVDSHLDLSIIEKITFNATKGDVTGNLTYGLMIVPEKVTADRANPMGSGEAAIIQALPVIVIVSLILAVIGLFVRSRF